MSLTLLTNVARLQDKYVPTPDDISISSAGDDTISI
jgi:hypothetical protein